MSHSRVIGLMGPTGVGKTAVAVELACLLHTKIISCDSMQVYQGFPVLTNQPSSTEDQPGLHLLVGFLEPEKNMSAGEYASQARPLIASEAASGWAVVAGGSGLYMRAALAPLAAPAPVDEELRRGLEVRAATEGAGALHAELTRLDAAAAASIDPRNVRRVVRALEAVLTGESGWSGRSDLWQPDYYHQTLVVGLTMERQHLAERIFARTWRMLQCGAVEEVRRFCEERAAEESRPGLAGICSAIGYEDIWRHLRGELSLEGAVDRIASATRQYARRQLTWLRKVKDAVIIDVHDRGAAEIAQQIVDLARSDRYNKEPSRR